MIGASCVLGATFGLGLVCLVAAFRKPVLGEEPDAGAGRRGLARFGRLPLRLGSAAVLAVAAGALTRWPTAVVLLGTAGFMAPSLASGQGARRAQLDRVEAIAGWAEMLRDTLAGAGGLEQSIMATAAVAPAAIRTEVRNLASRLDHQRLGPALRDFADEVDDRSGDLVVAALLLAADRSPRKLGDLLGRLAQASRAEVNMRLRIEASRARTRTSVRVVTIFTSLFAIGLVVFNRDYLAPYDSALGQLVLGLVGACFAGAYTWLGRSFRYGGDDRLLQRAGADEVPPMQARHRSPVASGAVRRP